MLRMPGKQIVYIVDDDEEVRWGLTTALTHSGFCVRSFASAEEFLVDGLACIVRSACLLIDIRLPGMDGPTLQNELLQRGLDLPIVMISGHADVTTAVEVMQAGAVDLLQKPFTTATLVERLRKTFQKREANLDAQRRREEVQEKLTALSRRERDVLDEILAGRTNKQISATLDIGIQTVAKHKNRILKKLEVRNDLELMLLLTGERSGM